jgi:bifunctional NMN adenylyltransferase/nudix hydrolase
MFDLIVNIGRFQIYHDGHYNNHISGLKLAKNMIIFIGSINRHDLENNPFSFEQRKLLISENLKPYTDRLFIKGICDFEDNMVWKNEILKKIKEISNTNNIGLIGFNKDNSSFYLNMFQEFKLINTTPTLDKCGNIINAKDLRHLYYQNKINKIENISNITKQILYSFRGNIGE